MKNRFIEDDSGAFVFHFPEAKKARKGKRKTKAFKLVYNRKQGAFVPEKERKEEEK